MSPGEASEHESSLEFFPSHLLFVYIAVSRLAPETGMYTNFKGFNKMGEPLETRISDANRIDVALEPSDALIWQDGLKYQWNFRGGGRD